jgi:hypothetical protein
MQSIFFINMSPKKNIFRHIDFRSVAGKFLSITYVQIDELLPQHIRWDIES